MKLNRISNSDLVVSEICLGTMTFGEQNDENDAHAQLDYAFEQGVNFIDAAEMYPVPPKSETQGRTESYIGTWLKKQNRESIIVATKITAPGRGFGWIRGGPEAIDRPSIEEALNNSLRRLQTDYIDLYQIHWPDRYVPNFGEWSFDPNQIRPAVSIREQMEALSECVKSGKVRYVGVSNETPWGILEFLRVSKDLCLPSIISTQNAYNLLNRSFEAGLAEVSYYNNIPLLAYSPLAFGHLTGKYLNDIAPEGSRLGLYPKFGQRYEKPNVRAASSAYAELASRSGMSATAMAIAFVCSRWFVASNIVGATTIRQLTEIIKSAQLTLPPELLREIDATYLKYTNPAV